MQKNQAKQNLPDPWLSLLYRVVERAALDASRGDAEAVAWLAGPDALQFCELVGMDRNKIYRLARRRQIAVSLRKSIKQYLRKEQEYATTV